MPDNEILTERHGHLGVITLNRPSAINALTFAMVERITATLRAWAHNDAVAVIAIEGVGERGFCAGADIKALRDAVLAGDDLGDRFFALEYEMNALIASYPKPIVSFLDGIVMGGGVGLGAHASHRLVTERSRVAMPEVGIGFFPDVGATWLLARAPGQLGVHLALTGDPIDGASAIRCGLADRMLSSADWEVVRDRLATESADAALMDCPIPDDAPIDTDRTWIDAVYARDSVIEILAALDERPEPAARNAAASIRTRSPISLMVTRRALREAASLSGLDAALARELHLARTFLRIYDYAEGVRAAVVDKDRNPRWHPATLEAVTAADLAPFFPADGGVRER